MSGKMLIVTGTGTGIGKTHVAEALLLALRDKDRRAAGIKPIESGGDGPDSDALRLRRASSFHVKHSGLRLKEPISPHLAARREGVAVDVHRLAREARLCLDDVDVLVVELAGGLFTPLTYEALNVDFAARLGGDALLLVAPDRLGALHDTLATVRAAEAVGVAVDTIVLVTPEQSDASTATNGAELVRLLPERRIAGTLPRAAPAVLADHPVVARITARLLR